MSISFRQKILLAVAPALVVVMLLGGVLARSTRRDSRVARGDLHAASAARTAMQLIDALQTESSAVVDRLAAGNLASPVDVTGEIDRTDESAARLETLLAVASRVPEVERVTRSITEGLAVIRVSLQSGVNVDDVLERYDALQNDVSTLTVVLVGSARSTRLNARSNEVLALLALKEQYSRQLLELQGNLDGAAASIDDAVAYRQSAEVTDRSIARFVAITRPRTRARFDRLRAGSLGGIAELADVYLADADAQRVPKVSLASWMAARATAMDELHRLETDLFDEFVSLADEVETNARRRAVLYIALSLVALVTAALAAALVGRSLGRRLSAVRDAARLIVADQLPAVLEAHRGASTATISAAMPEIALNGRDEVGDLVADLNRLLRLTVETSVEHSVRYAAVAHSQRQAAVLTSLLVNLGRRNQALIERQLEVIDRLEAEQSDPEMLSGLFQLDHMITRQRRSAESLLVLAGARRTRGWTDSLPISQVLRGAISEVALMDRVVLDVPPDDDLVLLGAYAIDLAHLLAELIENATLYSGPATQVRVRVHRTDELVRILIVDAGVGMTGEQLAAAHHILSFRIEVDEVTVDQVGFQVAGRLAQLIGVGVRLHNGPDGGIVAVVEAPLDRFEFAFNGPQHRRRARGEPVTINLPGPIELTDSAMSAIEFDLAALTGPSVVLSGLVVAGDNGPAGPEKWRAPLPRRQPGRDAARNPSAPVDLPDAADSSCNRPRLPTARVSPVDRDADLERRRSLAGFIDGGVAARAEHEAPARP